MPPLNLYNMWKLNPYIRHYDDNTLYKWNYWFLIDDYVYLNKNNKKETKYEK